MAFKNYFGGQGGRRVLEGANFAVYTVIVIAILVIANWFVSGHDHSWDLTPNKKYSLAPQTVKLLKGLNQDVTIYVFDRERSFGERRDLLNMYSTASRRVNVRYVDVDRQPSLARQYGVRTYGTIVLAAGDRHYEAQSDSEEAISNALIRLFKGQRTACFIAGHGERDLESSERTGYSKIKKEFENENYLTKSVTLLQKMEIPSDCSMVIVAGPKTDYLPQEVDTIGKYVTGGGRALFMLDPAVDLPELSKLLAGWNVTVRNDLVIDENPVAQLFGTEPTMPLDPQVWLQSHCAAHCPRGLPVSFHPVVLGGEGIQSRRDHGFFLRDIGCKLWGDGFQSQYAPGFIPRREGHQGSAYGGGFRHSERRG